MYELSRDLFRRLLPGLEPGIRVREHSVRDLLHSCEEAVSLIARTPTARRLHAAMLFRQFRWLVPASRQRQLLDHIDDAVEETYRQLVESRRGDTGSLLRCAAANGRGDGCMREPLAGRRYCPSHKHLETDNRVLAGSASR